MAAINGISPSLPASNVHEKHASAPSDSSTPAFSLPVRQLPASTTGMRPGSVSKDPAVDHLPHGKSGADIQEEALKLHAYRLQLIASNIANADTPNYKAVDIDFREALRVSQMTGASSAMHTDQTLHSQGSSSAIPQLLSYKYSVPVQGSVDGNTVELDAERAKFAESAVRYEFSLNRIGGHYKMMMELLTTLKD